MGIWSPEAYDELLLHKVKTLLSAALDNPRRPSRIGYEQFVRDLDEGHKTNVAAIEAIVYETTVRRRRPPAAGRSGASTNAANPAPPGGHAALRRQALANSGEHDASALRIGSRMRVRGGLHIASSSSESSSEDDMVVGEEVIAQEVERFPLVQEALARTRRQRGMDMERAEQEDALMDDGEAGAAAAAARRLRARGISALARQPRPEPSDLARTNREASSNRPAQASRTDGWLSEDSATSPHRMRPHPINAFPSLPTFEELWTVLLDDLPYPRESIHSLPDLVRAINTSTFSTTQLLADDMRALVTELQERDPTLAIRIGNAIRRRNPRAARSPARGAGGGGAVAGAAARALPSLGSLGSLFREHVTSADGLGSQEFDARPFDLFTQANRALDRAERDREDGLAAGEGAQAAAATPRTTYDNLVQALDLAPPPNLNSPSAVESPSANASGAATPHTAADTPASSLAQSPSCPSPPPLSAAAAAPPRLTSAQIAEAAQIARRRIAPLPSSSLATSGPLASARAARAREQDDDSDVADAAPDLPSTRTGMGAGLRRASSVRRAVRTIPRDQDGGEGDGRPRTTRVSLASLLMDGWE